MPPSSDSPTLPYPEGPASSMASGSKPSNAAPSSAPVAKATMNGRARARAASGTSRNRLASSTPATPPSSVKPMIQPSVFMCAFSVPPDEAGHSTGGRAPEMLYVAAMRVEIRGVVIGAKAAAGDRADALALQAQSCQRVKVALPTPGVIGCEGFRRSRILLQEGRADFSADFEMPGADGRSHPGLNADAGRSTGAQRLQCRLDHAGGESTPARMHRADHRAIRGAQQHGQTVRCQHG